MADYSGGYTLELRIPHYLIADHLAFSVVDVDDPLTRAIVRETASAPMAALNTLGEWCDPTLKLSG